MLSLHWSSSDVTALSLVESFIVVLRQLSYAIKNQLKDRFFPCMEAYPSNKSKIWIYLIET